MTAAARQNIPQELRSYPQWICHDADKRPINPHTGQSADVSDATTWGTFDEACAACDAGKGVGPGFVFTENDPFVGLDLDVPEGGTASPLQQQVYAAFPSYAERSPSGRGLHIIVKGRLAAAIKESAQGIEAYSTRRYFTFTGDVVRDERPLELQEALDALSAVLRPQQDPQASPGDAPERESDAAIVERAKAAPNGAKFVKLWAGEWEADYPSQSDGDQALANFLAFYTQNRAQIVRMFRASGLGQRPKAQRDDYVNRTVERALDQIVPPIDLTAFKEWVRVTVEGWRVARANTGWFVASDFAGRAVAPRPWHARGFIPTHTPV